MTESSNKKHSYRRRKFLENLQHVLGIDVTISEYELGFDRVVEDMVVIYKYMNGIVGNPASFTQIKSNEEVTGHIVSVTNAAKSQLNIGVVKDHNRVTITSWVEADKFPRITSTTCKDHGKVKLYSEDGFNETLPLRVVEDIILPLYNHCNPGEEESLQPRKFHGYDKEYCDSELIHNCVVYNPRAL